MVEPGGNISGGATTTGIGTLHTGAQTWSGNASTGGDVVETDGTTNDLLVMTGLTVTATANAPFYVTAAGSGVQLSSGATLLIATGPERSGDCAGKTRVGAPGRCEIRCTCRVPGRDGRRLANVAPAAPDRDSRHRPIGVSAM